MCQVDWCVKWIGLFLRVKWIGVRIDIYFERDVENEDCNRSRRKEAFLCMKWVDV